MSQTILELIKQNKSASEFFDGHRVRTERWGINEFLKIPTFYRNRPVENRLRKKKNELKKGFLYTHLDVKVGRVMSKFGPYNIGDLYVMDGNTRAMLWKMDPGMRPNEDLLVTVIDINDVNEAERTYASIDNISSAETSQEKVGGFFRSINYVPIGKRMREGRISTAVNDASRYVEYFNGVPYKEATIFDKISFFMNELSFLDKWGIDNVKNLSSNLLSCLLMIGKKYGVNNIRYHKMLDLIKHGTSEINENDYCDGTFYVMNKLYPENIDKWKITGHQKSPELLYEILYSLDCFMNSEKLRKKKNYAVSKNIRHREFFQHYFM
jgi:hypothetical protein